MTSVLNPTTTTTPKERSGLATAFRMLWRDKLALIAAIFLTIIVLSAIFGPMLVGPEATTMNLRMRNAAPFQLDKGWLFFLGADTLGRSILARIMVASRNTMAVAAGAVLLSALIGTTLGLIAGFRGGWVASVIMRLADILMSFPSLLLAVVVLYVLEPRVSNVVLVLAVTRVPVYLRTVRAEVLEVRERMFVLAARVMGASPWRIVWRHMLPVVVPTLITVATLDFAFIMLAESSLSFLGLGIQPPEISWGLMVADGRNYLSSAWWLAFWPGLAIMLTTTALNLLSNWVRIATDPKQRWRLEQSRAATATAGDDDE
ncbi:ABC transporter permease [Starkeya sp. ORNL1]|nr:ABC transporter permease [Starkeya sp. ORNL1]QJP15647.1 ABC transporter permease [Starkeya sp. ORNL1]